MDATTSVGIGTLIGTYCDGLTDFVRRGSGVRLLHVVASSLHGCQSIRFRPLPSSMRSGTK